MRGLPDARTVDIQNAAVAEQYAFDKRFSAAGIGTTSTGVAVRGVGLPSGAFRKFRGGLIYDAAN
jgi:hypothetical protein